MSRKDRKSRDRKRPPARPSRGRRRGDGGFHQWRILVPSNCPIPGLPRGGYHDVHITDAIPFAGHNGILETVGKFHLVTPQMFDHAKGFYRSELRLAEFGRLIMSTDPSHNETWVWLE